MVRIANTGRITNVDNDNTFPTVCYTRPNYPARVTKMEKCAHEKCGYHMVFEWSMI